MAYNHGREDRKWRIWKEAEEKVLREHGIDEAVIEQIRMEDRTDFNSNRRFYRWTSDFGEYLEGMVDAEQQAEPNTVADLLDEIEDEKLYQALPICNYQGLKELDATVVNAPIDKILVSEREKSADGTVKQEIKIYYKFIGFVGELHITPTKRWTALPAKHCTVCGVEYIMIIKIEKSIENIVRLPLAAYK